MALHRLFILAFAALPFVASEAAAQDAGRYRTWDRNNDGVITRSEWRGTLQEFRELDWNRDGVLSGSELNRWDDDNDDDDDDDFYTSAQFDTLDRNGNGRISRGEWRGDRATFRQLDRNADNQISEREFLAANVSNRTSTVDFDNLDWNNDGYIDRREWRGTLAQFNQIDLNRDGYLSRYEIQVSDVGTTSNTGRTTEFDELDYNNNGVISRGEWRGDSSTFTHYDANRDGVISRTEYLRHDESNTSSRSFEQAIRVDARQQWTDSGIYVNAGDTVFYRAEGQITMSDANDRATANGAISGRRANGSPRPDQRAGVLIGRIGNSSVAVLGESGSFTAQTSGQLYLGVNDDHFADNTGEYRVVVSVGQRF